MGAVEKNVSNKLLVLNLQNKNIVTNRNKKT